MFYECAILGTEILLIVVLPSRQFCQIKCPQIDEASLMYALWKLLFYSLNSLRDPSTYYTKYNTEHYARS
jgi:hypothetical protein